MATRRPAAPPKKAPKPSPRTPAKGSSPISPPAGSARRPATPPARQGPRPPGAARVSPAAQALLRRRQQANRAAPQPRAPAGTAPTTPQPVRVNPHQAGAGPLSGMPPAAVPNIYAQRNAAHVAATSAHAEAQRPLLNPQALMTGALPVVRPDVASADFGPAFGPVFDRHRDNFTQAIDDIDKPVEDFTPPPGMDPQNAYGGSATPRTNQTVAPTNWAVRENDDGSTDWVDTTDLTGKTQAPRTRPRPAGTLDQIGNAAKGLGGALLQSFSAPAQLLKVVGGVVNQPGVKVVRPVVLPAGKSFTPPTSAQPRPMDTSFRYLAMGNETLANLPDIARQTYGATPEVDAALQAATSMLYSSGEAQLRAVARMVEFGEEPNSAIHGNHTYVEDVLLSQGYLDDPVAAIKADPLANYVYEVLHDKGQTDTEILDLFNTRGLPGEAELMSELIGEALFDPLNALDLPGKAASEAIGVRNARIDFAPSARTLEQTVERFRKMFAPTANDTLNAVIPWAHTPTSVRSKITELAADATSLILSEAAKGAGQVDALGNLKPTLFTTLKAFIDSASPAPLRADFPSAEEFALATKAWQASVDAAANVLKPYHIANSDAGRLGAAITREILTDDAGRISGQAVKNLLDNTQPLHERMAAMLTHYERAAEGLLDPARATVKGSETATEWAKRTGGALDQFPLFERGFAGAQEAARVGKPLGKGEQALRIAADTRGWVNNGLWHLFATANPAYSFRNAMNNLVTAVVDGNMSFASLDEAVRFTTDVLAGPQAATRGMGMIATNTGEGVKGADRVSKGFAGNLRVGGVPLGAQAIEQSFSQRIVYTAAKRYWDKMMVIGRAIPELPDDVTRALGGDVVRGLVQQLQTNGGDVNAAIGWLKKSVGTYDTWRILADDAVQALGDFSPEFQGRVMQVLDSSATPDEFRAGMAAIRREVRDSLNAAEDSVPAFGASQSEMGAAYGEDMELARSLGQAPDPEEFGPEITGAWLDEQRAQTVAQEAVSRHLDEMPEGSTLFDAQVDLDRQARDGAMDAAQTAVKRSQNPRAVDDYMAAAKTVNGKNREARAAHDALRRKAMAYSAKLNGMGAQGSLNKNVVAQRNSAMWAKYRQQRDEIWQAFREFAVDEWAKIANQWGVPYVDDVPVSAADEMAQGEAEYRAAVEAEARVEAMGGTLANELTAADKKRIFGAGSTHAQPQAKMLWTRVDPETKRVIWLEQRFPPKGAPVKWDGNPQKWHRTPANEVDAWVEQVYEKVAGGFHGLTPTEMWAELVRGYRSSVAGARRPSMAGASVVQGPPPAAIIPPAPAADAIPGGPAANIIDQGPNAPMGFGVPDPTVAAPIPGGPPVKVGLTGFSEAPIPRRWTPADPRSILSVLDSVQAKALRGWGQTRVNHGFTDAANEQLALWAQEAVASINEHRALAARVGVEARNFALLDYTDRRNLDTLLSFVMPYHYWYGRTYKNWLTRAVLNPGALANYSRYRQALEEMHGALPEWQRQQLSTDDLGLDLDTPLMFNLEATLSPMYGILGADFSSPERRRAQLFGMHGFGAFAEDMAAFGPSLWTPITWAMAWSSAQAGDKEAAQAWVDNYLGSTGRALRSASALVEEWSGRQSPIPAGGVNLDPQMMLMNGGKMNGTTQWEEDRIGKILTDMRDNPPAGVDPNDWTAQLMEAGYTQSGDLWEQAKQEMFAGTAPYVLASYAFGVGFKGRAGYEVEFTQIWNEVSRIYSQSATMTPEKIQQAFLDLEKRHPDYQLLMLTHAAGPRRDDAWVWEAFSRVGIANSDKWADAGVSQAALDAFYAAKGTLGMDPRLLAELLDGATAINASYRPVSLEEQQRQLDAKFAYLAIQDRIKKTFPASAQDLEARYHDAKDRLGPEGAKAFLDGLTEGQRGSLFQMWDARSQLLLAEDPTVERYYLDLERYAAIVRSRFYDEWEAQYPDIKAVEQAYFDLEGDYRARTLLLEAHPELKEYWDAKDKFYGGQLQAEVKAWLNTLPEVEQMELRGDVTAANKAQADLAQAAKDEELAFMGGLSEEPGVGSGGGSPNRPASSSLADQFRALVEAEQAAKEEDASYINPENNDAYIEANLEPMYQAYGAGALEVMTQPFAEAWMPSQFGLNGLLAFVGENESIREALLASSIAEPDSGNWVYYISVLRDLPPEQLAALSRKYPQLADAAIVAEQALNYDAPSRAALHDILGFSVNLREDGTWSITRESIKIDKKTGKALYDTGGNATRAGGGGGGGGLSRTTYGRLMGDEERRSGGGGGSRGRRGGGGGGGGNAPAPDPELDALGSWAAFSGELKLTSANGPRLLSLLMEFFDVQGPYRDRLLQDYPELAALLQSLDPARLQMLEQGYLAWRLESEGLDREQENDFRERARPNILRVYQPRPAKAGLPG